MNLKHLIPGNRVTAAWTIIAGIAAVLCTCFSIKLSLFVIALWLVMTFLKRLPVIYLYGCMIIALCFVPESGREFFPSFISIADILLVCIGVRWLIARLNHHDNPIPSSVCITGSLFLLSGLGAAVAGRYYGAFLSWTIVDFIQRCGYAFVMMMSFNDLQNVSNTKRIVQWVIICTGCVALYGILQTLFGYTIINYAKNGFSFLGYYVYSPEYIEKFIWWSPLMIRKPFSPFFGPNSMASLMLIAFPVSLVLFRDKMLHIPRWLYGIILSLIFICLLLTYSRACQVALIAILCLYGLFELIVKHKFPSILLALVILTIFLPRVFLAIHEISRPVTRDKARSATKLFQQIKLANIESKMAELRYSFHVLRQCPTLGIGFSTAMRADNHVVPSKHFTGVSNVYLEILNKMGVIGLIIYLCLISIVLWPATALIVSHPGDTSLLLGLVLSVATTLINGLFDHTFMTTPALACLFWVMMGAVMAVTRAGISGGFQRQGPDSNIQPPIEQSSA